MINRLATHAQLAAEQYLADPVNGGPSQIPGIGADVNTLWSYATYGVAIICAFLLAGAGVVAAANHQAGRPNDGVGKAAVILAVAVGVGAIGGVIGTITGT